MIRTGIYQLEQIKKNRLLDIFGTQKNISIKIYQDIMTQEGLDHEKYSEIILNRFNSNSNVMKRTYRNRNNNFDDLVVKLIKEQHFDKNSIHDIAISDGRASCYLINLLKNSFQNIAYQGSDVAIAYDLYEIKNSNTYIVMDENKNIIEITTPPFVWNYARREKSFFFINNLLKKMKLKSIRKIIKSNLLCPPKKIVIVDKEYNSLISGNENFKIVNYNLFQKCDKTFSIIRVMNLLHFEINCN